MAAEYYHPDRLKPVVRGQGGGIKLNAEWFQNIVKRIEQIKPVAVGQSNNQQSGSNPLIEVVNRPEGDGREIRLNAVAQTIVVCSAGMPETITVLMVPK